MNNCPITEINEITKKENEQLKAVMNPKDSPLIDYYLSRYLEIHEYTLSTRIAKLDEDIAKCQKEYEIIMAREDRLEEIAKKNKEIQHQIDIINSKININNDTLEQRKNEFKETADKVTEQENNLYSTCLDYYNNILSKLNRGNVNETLEYINFVMDVLKYTVYDEVVKYLNDAKSALKDLDEINMLEPQIKKNNLTLQLDKQRLEEGLEVISYEETENKLDAIAFEKTNKKNAKTELTNLFSKLKVQNLKHIVDEIQHFGILEYTNQQIALKIDEMISAFGSSLATVDTDANIIANKRLQIKKLTDQLNELTPLKEDYDQAQEEYNNLFSMYQTISKNIDEIDNYIHQAKKLIESNPDFKEVVKKYQDIQIKQVTLEQDKRTYYVRNINLVETRKSKLNDPYGKNELERIDVELKEVQEKLSYAENELLSLNQELCKIINNEQDSKVITIYEQAKMCEEKIDYLNDKQREFSSMVNDKYIYIANLKGKVSNYDQLVAEIEALNEEIENF